MDKKRTYFPRTTAQQRQLLFETWEATGSVTEACRKARVCRQTFYKWKSRFEARGYAGLKEAFNHAPKNPRQIPDEVFRRVIDMKRQNPSWGKRRIADELAKRNSWVSVVSPNSVRRILRDAGLWSETIPSTQKGGHKARPAVRMFRGKR